MAIGKLVLYYLPRAMLIWVPILIAALVLKKKNIVLKNGHYVRFVLIMLLGLVLITDAFLSVSVLGIGREGNSSKYNPEKQETVADSPLRGKTILSIGSSVAKGTGTGFKCSYNEYLEAIDGAIIISEAKAGTTLAVADPPTGKSYVERVLNNVDKKAHVDIVLLQLSTNDATSGQELGEISSSYDLDDFDVTTTCGAVEYLIKYCIETWDCPVVMYSGTYFEPGIMYQPGNYAAMVEQMHLMEEKWGEFGFSFVDQWNDPKMLAVTEEEYALYMCDGVHPMKAGYLLWWLPNLQQALYAGITNSSVS